MFLWKKNRQLNNPLFCFFTQNPNATIKDNAVPVNEQHKISYRIKGPQKMLAA